MSSPHTVLIVDDHPSIRDAFATLVRFTPDMNLWGTAESANDALARLAGATAEGIPLPDVLVTDLSMAERSGIELLHEIRALYPDLPGIVLSAHRADIYAAQATAAGAAAYVEKRDVAALLDVIRRVAPAR